MNLKAQPYLQQLDVAMRSIVSRHLPQEDGFGVMLRYALGWSDEHDRPYNLPAGKRLRPLVLLLTAHALNDNWQQALPAAAAVELLHNFSLIHDDIQDASPIRHNRPTVWQVWGIPNAINAGDAMFTLSYAALADLASTCPPDVVLQAWQVFNYTNAELTRGQHLDMRFEGQASVSTDAYLSMIAGKSAALIAASTQLGALIATGSAERAAHFHAFGHALGIAFQIHDDILGIWGDPQITGKSTATDIISRKKSLPVLFGIARDEHLAALYADPTPFTDDRVAEIISRLDAAGAQDYTRSLEATYYESALRALSEGSPRPAYAPLLEEFVNYLFQRTS